MVINQSLLNVSISFERRLPRYWWSQGITYYLRHKIDCLRLGLKCFNTSVEFYFSWKEYFPGFWYLMSVSEILAIFLLIMRRTFWEISTWTLPWQIPGAELWNILRIKRKWLGDTVDCEPSLVQKMFEIFQLRNNNRGKEPRRGRWPAGWSGAEIIDDEDDCSDRSG